MRRCHETKKVEFHQNKPKCGNSNLAWLQNWIESSNHPSHGTVALDCKLLSDFKNTFCQHKSHKTMCQFSQQHCYVLPKKPYTLAGFEPGSDVMTISPHRHGKKMYTYEYNGIDCFC
jgi:hypothetical protein